MVCPLTGMAIVASSWQGLLLGEVTKFLVRTIFHLEARAGLHTLAPTSRGDWRSLSSGFSIKLSVAEIWLSQHRKKSWLLLGSDSLSAVRLGNFWNEALRGVEQNLQFRPIGDGWHMMIPKNYGNISWKKFSIIPWAHGMLSKGCPSNPGRCSAAFTEKRELPLPYNVTTHGSKFYVQKNKKSLVNVQLWSCITRHVQRSPKIATLQWHWLAYH